MNPYQFSQPSLIIVDPLNRFNNIGKSSYNFAMIQQEFKEVYSRLNEQMILFVKHCASKHNSVPEPTPFSVDQLIPKILNISYKHSKPAPS